MPATGCSSALVWAEHWARISTVLVRDAARSVKSTGCAVFGTVNVAVTGLVVPNGNAGTETLAFDTLTTLRLWSPMPMFTMSTVTEPAPAVIAWNAPELPGNTSVTVSVGVQTPGTGVGV